MLPFENTVENRWKHSKTKPTRLAQEKIRQVANTGK